MGLQTMGCHWDPKPRHGFECGSIPRVHSSMQITGEQLVLAANGADGLATVSLRPSGIFGEGDPLFVPVLVEKAKIGKLKYVIGNGSNLMDFTYVGNVAHAHVLVRFHTTKNVPLHQCCSWTSCNMPTHRTADSLLYSPC